MADQTDGFLSPFLRKKRIEMALPFIKGRVIDIGCGVGKLAKYVEAENYVGIDLVLIRISSVSAPPKENIQITRFIH